MKKILIPTDFSPTALKAVMYAAEIAKKSDAKLYLLHVLEAIEDNLRQPFSLHDKYLVEVTNARIEDLEEIIKIVLKQYPGIKIEADLANGAISSAIQENAKRLHADIIVMGTTGASGFKELFIGSNASAVIKKSTLPVLLIPGLYEMKEPRIIVFATNHFEKKKHLLGAIVSLSGYFKAAVKILVVAKDDAEKELNTSLLEKYIIHLHKTYPELNFLGEVVIGENPEETIESYHKLHQADIVALVKYPKSFLENLFITATTRKMAFNTSIPLLVLTAE